MYLTSTLKRSRAQLTCVPRGTCRQIMHFGRLGRCLCHLIVMANRNVTIDPYAAGAALQLMQTIGIGSEDEEQMRRILSHKVCKGLAALGPEPALVGTAQR